MTASEILLSTGAPSTFWTLGSMEEAASITYPHYLFEFSLRIRPFRLSPSPKVSYNVTELEQGGVNSANVGMKTGVGA